MTLLLDDFCEFLENSPTSWHATLEMGNRLASLDYTPLNLDEKWKLEKGAKYFVIHDGSMIAFALPEAKPEKMALMTAHTDSPALKLKPNPEIHKQNMEFLGVEIYGSPTLASWVNRDLGIAGRVMIEKQNGRMEESFVFFEDTPVLIPLIAPHLDREIFKEGLKLNKQDHLAPLVGLKDKAVSRSYVETLLKREHSFRKLLDFDLFLVPLDFPRYIGKDAELLASYRLDNLASTHAGVIALGNLKKPAKKLLCMGIFWDHEEIGSSTHSGAESPFFQDVYDRICDCYKLSKEDEAIMRQRSMCLSIDMTHGFNPHYENKYDPQHIPLLGEGITIKYNANKRYSTSGKSGAFVTKLCDGLKLPVQKFVNRTDNPPGSTVGPIFATKMGIEVADIGIPQLSMHAAREVIACQDYLDLCKLLTHFLKVGS